MGSTVPVPVTPFRNEHGEIVRWYATGTDIDYRKRAEKELHRSNNALSVYKQLVYSSMDGILAFDKEGRYTLLPPHMQ